MERPIEQHAALEAEITELAREVREEHGEVSREAILKTVQRKTDELSPVDRTLPVIEEKTNRSAGPLPAYAKNIPPETRLRAEELIDYAFHKGIHAAIEKVSKDEPVVMKLFHDAITEKLYNEFQNRGLLLKRAA